MLKLLYIILTVDILALVFSFFMLLSTSVAYAVVFAAVGLLGLVPILVLINHVESIEQLKNDVARLQSEVKRLSDTLNGSSPLKENGAPVLIKNEPSRAVWECVKCGTVNKAGTNLCANCNAEYSPFVNPTDNTDKKKKLSRWVK